MGEDLDKRSTPRPLDKRDPLVGQMVADKYKILGLVARGGMGRIYKAEQVPLGRTVAVKILNAKFAGAEQDPNFQKRFLQEAATAGRLKHPNTVTVYDYGSTMDAGESTLFMVMEFIEGRTLYDAITDDQPFSEKRAVRIVREIARSLKEAHKLGVVHRDLKPRNVMLVDRDDGESVKVVDFGIAKLLEDDSEGLTLHDNIVGSPKYMAPEQIRHETMDGRTDIYALGVVLYEMLAGVPPFESPKAVDILVQHLTCEVPPIATRVGRVVSNDLDAVVHKCLRKAREERYKDIDELVAALRTLENVSLEDGTQETSRSGSQPLPIPTLVDASGTMEQPPPAASNRVALIGIVALLGAILLVVLVVGGALLGGFGGEVETSPEPPIVATVPVVEEPPPPPPPVEPAAVPGQLLIESTPPGAEIWEGNRLLGRTPLPVPLLATGADRQFRLELAGYQPFEFAQPPGSADATYRAPLVAIPKKAPPPKVQKPPDTPKPRTDDIKGKR